MNQRYVAVVGVGAITPIGNSVNEYWKNLLGNQSGVRRITEWDTSRSRVKIAGTVESFSLDNSFLGTQSLSRSSKFALAATKEALEDACLLRDDLTLNTDLENVVVELGTWAGNTFEHEAHLKNFLYPQIFEQILGNYISTKDAAKRKVLFENIIQPLINRLPDGPDNIFRNTEESLKQQNDFSKKDKILTSLYGRLKTFNLDDYIKPHNLVYDITPDRLSSILSSSFGIKGETQQVGNACASGITAIGEAYRKIKFGVGDVAICGGVDAANYPYMISLFSAIDWLSCNHNNNPQSASKPFDMDSDNFVQAEGCGILVLEELEHAIKRGARIYGLVKGYSATMNPDKRGEQTADGYIRALKRAIEESGLKPKDIQYFSSCAVAFGESDYYELHALEKVFGKTLPYVSSIKSFIGHPYAAAGPIQAITNLKSLETGILIPTRNLVKPVEKYKPFLITEQLHIPNLRNTIASGHGCGNHCAEIILGDYK